MGGVCGYTVIMIRNGQLIDDSAQELWINALRDVDWIVVVVVPFYALLVVRIFIVRAGVVCLSFVAVQRQTDVRFVQRHIV